MEYDRAASIVLILWSARRLDRVDIVPNLGSITNSFGNVTFIKSDSKTTVFKI